MTEFSLDIDMKDLQQAIAKVPRIIAESIKAAGKESADEVMDTRGLRNYPPETSANFPPTPYYVRGRGTEYGSGNDYSSERYGSQWNVRVYADKVVIGNRASYAPFVGGHPPALHMSKKGWKSLVGIANTKLPIIRRIYEKWIARGLKRAGFK